MDESIDGSNRFIVAARGRTPMMEIVVIKPVSVLSRDDALNLAAWLVTLADPDGTLFDAYLGAAQG